MTSPLADRLAAVRHERFVGRADERALFRAILAEPSPPFYVIYIFGPGGIGKTSLLGEFSHACYEANTPVIHIDGRNIEPVPEVFLAALRSAMGLSPQESPLQAMASSGKRHVLMIDTYELLAPLDGWLSEHFLPRLPQNVLVVLAGRQPPSMAWRTDPGWQSMVRTIPLRNLGPDESRFLLTKRRVPSEQHREVLQFTHGHPLALSLVADVVAQRPEGRFQPETSPDVVKMLLEHLVQRVPGPAHRRALEICAVVRLTTEGLLAEMLSMPDAHELFEWLRGLSFIESGPLGIFPHDLAREALNADLRWRDPSWYIEVHRRARQHYLRRLQETRGLEQQRVLFDYIFLHRDNPVVRPYFEWQESGSALAGPMRPTDVPVLRAMVAQHEGEESALLAQHWLTHQPQGVVVLRDAKDQPVGFFSMVALTQATPEDMKEDQAVKLVSDYLGRRAPLRPGEQATFFRFWMAADAYQAVSSIQSVIFVNVVRHYLTTPGLAFTFFPCAGPDFWAPVFSYADLERISEADFQVGGRRYGMYGHDWRIRPPLAWLELLGERETADTLTLGAAPSAPETLLVLSQPDFEDAVRDALRNFTRPDVLVSNPLGRSRLVVGRAGSGAGQPDRIVALQALIMEAAESLQASPRERRFYQALYHTYLEPVPSQEQAAEMLDVPFSTFRRHLRSGIERVTEFLWQSEVGVSEKVSRV